MQNYSVHFLQNEQTGILSKQKNRTYFQHMLTSSDTGEILVILNPSVTQCLVIIIWAFR